jgi:integrase
MRTQKGYLFHKGTAWFLRYSDDVMQTDKTIQRKQVCQKLDVAYGGEFRTKKSVAPFVAKILAPVNHGLLNAQSTMSVCDFVSTIYLPEYVEKELRPATRKQYKDIWANHLNPRMGDFTLRSFRTVDAQNILAKIAAQSKLGRSSLRHCKAFLSGAFKQCKRLGILDGLNPVQDVSVPRVPEAEQDTYAYTLPEISTMLARLAEPEKTIVLCAALTGFRKSELRGLQWQDFIGDQLFVRRSVWNSTTSLTKTKGSAKPIPVVKMLADALEAHRMRAGMLAQPDLPIFQAGNGKPLNLDNAVRRSISPSIERCSTCQKPEADHLPEAHMFKLDETIRWHGWHGFRRGLATNLHSLGIDDKTIQAILRHSTVGLTMNVYVKSVSADQVNAMDTLSEKLGTCNESATTQAQRIQ